jgi:hypothetical protein
MAGSRCICTESGSVAFGLAQHSFKTDPDIQDGCDSRSRIETRGAIVTAVS